MKVIAITQPGDPNVLQLEERQKPKRNKGEVIIQVKAAGINRPDIIQRQGKYPAPEGAPVDIPGLEVAGIVDDSDINSDWKKGDKVCALLAGGGYAEYVSVPEGQCLSIPRGLNFDEAASLPETYFTVWTNVFDRAGFNRGELVLVHGGTSGIGVAAIQMVSAMGGKVFATAGSDNKCLFAEKLGAVKCINYKTEDFESVITEHTDGLGVNIVLDMIGGPYTVKNINLLQEEGRLVMINAMKGRKVEIDLLKVMIKRIILTGSTLRSRDRHFKFKIAQKLNKHIWPLIEQKEIRPIIYKTFPLKLASEAHALMESSDHIGKIVLTV